MGKVSADAKSKAARKIAAKVYAKRKAEHQRVLRSIPTHNAKIIVDLLVSNRVGKPSDFKNYVIITGNRLVDWAGSQDMYRVEDGKEVGRLGFNGVAIVHKRKLHNIIGDDAADVFWSRKLGRRRPPKVDPRAQNG